jgi:hypothetical protein
MHDDSDGDYEDSEDNKHDDNDAYDYNSNSNLTAQTYWNVQCTGRYNSNRLKIRLLDASSTGKATRRAAT